jgi:hypothetical protein
MCWETLVIISQPVFCHNTIMVEGLKNRTISRKPTDI